MSVSVAMAACNGKPYIQEQVDSILEQLDGNAELIISCDPSADGTREYLRELYGGDGRVICIGGPGKGIAKNFENALKHCGNEYVFLSDQDDVWLPGKVENVMREFSRTHAALILHDAEIVDESLHCIQPSFFEWRGCKSGFYHNLLRNSYIGCCMAFKKELLSAALPFPDRLPMHDQWLGLLAERYAEVRLLNEPLIRYRRHGNNASSDRHAGVWQMLRWRTNLICEIYKRSGIWRTGKSAFSA